MKSNLKIFGVLLLLLACKENTHEVVYQENDGLIIIEVENHPPVEGWEFQNSEAGFSGEGYLVWNSEHINYDHTIGVLEFLLSVENEGEYYFRIHNKHDHEGDYTEDNDIFTQINDAKWMKTFSHLSHKIWGWDTRYEIEHLVFMDPPKVYLKKGINNFRVGGRSSGFKMDQIQFFHATQKPDTYQTNPDNPFVLAINKKDPNYEH